MNSYAKQCNKRLHELRMLGNLQIDGTMVDLFYKSTVEKHREILHCNVVPVHKSQ